MILTSFVAFDDFANLYLKFSIILESWKNRELDLITLCHDFLQENVSRNTSIYT